MTNSNALHQSFIASSSSFALHSTSSWISIVHYSSIYPFMMIWKENLFCAVATHIIYVRENIYYKIHAIGMHTHLLFKNLKAHEIDFTHQFIKSACLWMCLSYHNCEMEIDEWEERYWFNKETHFEQRERVMTTKSIELDIFDVDLVRAFHHTFIILR